MTRRVRRPKPVVSAESCRFVGFITGEWAESSGTLQRLLAERMFDVSYCNKNGFSADENSRADSATTWYEAPRG
jgi:hypothetical protein